MSDRNSDGPGFYLLPADEDLVVSGDEHGSYTLWRARTGGWRYPVAASPLPRHHSRRHEAAGGFRQGRRQPYQRRTLSTRSDLA